MAVPARGFALSLVVSLVLVGACSVFPDEAVLPEPSAANDGGAPSPADSGGAGATGLDAMGGELPTGGTFPTGATGGTSTGGTSSIGGTSSTSGTSTGSTGGAPDVAGGAAGQAGGAENTVLPGCNRQVTEVPVTADTWLDQGKINSTHGEEAELSLVGGKTERRILLSLTLPEGPAGATLRRALIRLNLEANGNEADVRRLALFNLTKAFDEASASWKNYGSGAWDVRGGDLGVELANTTVPAMTSTGVVDFNVSDAIVAAAGTAARVVSLAILESTAQADGAAAALTFTASETTADAANAPKLRLVYCLP